MKVSIIILCIDRYHHTKEYVGNAMRDAGHPFDLLIADNGSTNIDILNWQVEQKPTHLVRHGYNYGTTQAINHLIALNPSDAYVFLGNDIQMPQNWLAKMIEAYKEIPNAGMIGIDWRNMARRMGKALTQSGYIFTPSDYIFGSTFIPQSALDKVGSLCEDYGTYGLWDSDFAIRCKLADLQNLYVNNLASEHKGDDVGEKSEYRAMKDKSLEIGRPIFKANVERYQTTKEVFVPNKHIDYGSTKR
jgi:GT2 family glycosyltransferase